MTIRLPALSSKFDGVETRGRALPQSPSSPRQRLARPGVSGQARKD